MSSAPGTTRLTRPQRSGGRGVDGIAGQQQLHGDRVRQLLDDALSAAVTGDDAALHLREPESRVLGRDANIGPQQQRHAAAKAIAVDCGDHRLPNLQAAVEQLIALGEPHFSEPRRRGQEALEVGAHREGLFASSGHDGDANVGIVAHLRPGLRERRIVLGVHRVEALRTIDGHNGDTVRQREVDGQTHSSRPSARLP